MKIQICWTPNPGSFWFCFSMCAVCVWGWGALPAPLSTQPEGKKGPENNRCSMARGECARERMNE